MARTQRGYRCSACGHRAPAYMGRCPQCDAWSTMEPYQEAATAPAVAARVRRDGGGARVVPFRAESTVTVPRLATRIPEFDLVLGGGVVAGSVILVGGEPGIGKSTLMLQAAANVAASGGNVAYVCGEESPSQIQARGARLGVRGDGISLIAETGVETALDAALALDPALVIVDSIQSVFVEGLDRRAGGPAQLTEAGGRLVAWAKEHEIALILTGHVTKAGEIAGPRLLEHAVDVVLYFEGSGSAALRVLRAVKNRFGATDEVGVFEMGAAGLTSVENASAAFVDLASLRSSGCAATAVIEGTRPLAVEVQALAVRSFLSSPRRVASGIEVSRLHLLLAVLARRAGIDAGDRDVVATVAGGLRLRDPSADLAILAALASAVRDEPLRQGTALLGEVALSGRIRSVPQAPRRLAELARLGMTHCVAAPGLPKTEGIQVITAETVKEALELVLPR